MLVTNPVSNDPRVRREAGTLVNAGYQVVVIGVQGKESSQEEWSDGYRIIRLPLPRTLSHCLLLLLKAIAPRLYTVLRDRHRNINPRIPAGTIHAGQLLSKLRSLRVDLLNIIHVIRINIRMAKEAFKQRADIYHAHDLNTLLAGCLVARWQSKKLVYDFHELYTEQYKEGVKTNLWRFYYSSLERFLVKRTDLRLTVCDSLGEWATQRYGIGGIITVRNVPAYQENPPSQAAGRRREPVVLYHGGYSRDRGLEQLVASARYLRSGRIVFRGFGELEDRLRELAREKGVEDRVTFAPPVPMPELVKTAAEADIGVIPYIPFCLNNRFCLPNKLFEYLMAGLAVVGSDLPELRKVILGHSVGGVFDPEAPQDIARALNDLIEDEERLARMKRNALHAVRAVYNWQAESVKLLKAYESLVAVSALR